MFEQHPVPQQISSYQFRLVGDMTLKQFFQLAAGAVIGLIVYSLPLPGFFKWPIIVFVVIGGAAFAFLPIQDRPLEQWLVAFFRSIYAPTIFVWRKPAQPEQYFATDSQLAQPLVAPEVPESIPPDIATHALEQNERNFLSKISSMFGVHSGQPVAAPQMQTSTPTPPQLQPEPQKPQEILVPKQKPVEVASETPGFTPAPASQPVQSTPVGQVFSASTTVPAQAAQFSPEAAPPTPPTQPNVVVGQVMDVNGKIVEGAILEITDSEGRPVRALKTNKAGHFMIVTPLSGGTYQITTELDGLTFEPITITLAGAVVSPIAIKSTDALPEPAVTEGRAVWSPQ